MTNVVNSVSGNATIGGKLIQTGSLHGLSFTNGGVASGAVELSAEQLDRTVALWSSWLRWIRRRPWKQRLCWPSCAPSEQPGNGLVHLRVGGCAIPFASPLEEGKASVTALANRDRENCRDGPSEHPTDRPGPESRSITVLIKKV